MNRPGDVMPELTDAFVESISDRYIELYEHITGQSFTKAESEADVATRIEQNVSAWLAARQ